MKTSIFKSCLGVIVTLFFLTLATSAVAQDEYFIYANFDPTTDTLFQPGQACGGYAINDTSGNLYVARDDGQHCDVYIVSIPADSFPIPGPNRHPANSENLGPMVPRTLALVGSYDISNNIGGFAPQANEFYVDATHVYFGPSAGGIHQWDKNPDGTLGTYNGKVVNIPFYGQSLAYDTNRNLWYSGSSGRDIYSTPSGDDPWIKEFTHTNYAGSHHDGMEYAGGYLWISDMTSDFIGKWKYTGSGPFNGWDSVAVFSYSGGGGMDVEGMGYGPLGHFWATGWSEMYELGGGGLQVEEIPTLTEWGMIIFGLLLLGFITWVFLKRRKATAVSL